MEIDMDWTPTIQNMKIKHWKPSNKPMAHKIIQWNIENHNQICFVTEHTNYLNTPYQIQNTHKIIQWNCSGYKTNYNELLLLIAELKPTMICLQESLKNVVINQIWKTVYNMTTYMILE